jgi:glycosyltransferase involved in cell wall biosynthesis
MGARSRGAEISEILVTISFVLAAIGIWPLLVIRFGWMTGLLVGWFVAPVCAVAAAALVLLWTVPLRGSDALSLRPGRARGDNDADLAIPDIPAEISVIMPVFNGVQYLVHSLPPLMEMLKRGELKEVIVVDDGATDGSAAYAAGIGATVIPSGGRKGPGGARNIAAAQAKGDVLWFIDADVVVHADAAKYVRAAFAAPSVVAVFGSYDDRPAAANFGSQYKNLVHHHYHQHASPNASTFWSGCGAIQKSSFLAVGGFDADTYKSPSIEDVDLGYRLRAAGGLITLDRRLQSTHLKVWSVPELVRTDIFKRAIPWARMMLQRAEVIDDLNVGTFERLRAALAGVTVLVCAAVIIGLIPAWWLIPVLITVATANWHLFRLFWRQRGLLFGVEGLAFHQIYYLYSGATFVGCWLEAKLTPKPRPI